MYELLKSDVERVRPLIRKMDIHLPLQAILAGNVDAVVYVDDTDRPHSAITWVGHRVYLLGKPGDTELIASFRKIFLEKFSLQAWKAGHETYMLCYPDATWEVFIRAMLDQKYPIRMERAYYSVNASDVGGVPVPDGYELRVVDSSFLKEEWANPDFLTDEMVSERSSVADFIAKSFGVALVSGKTIVGWCLSEYNTSHRCEVGIGVEREFRRQGLGTVLATAFLDEARRRDYARIGWHCAASNTASAATALAANYEKTADYPAFFGWFDDELNLANNGYFAHSNGDFAGALEFYEKAIAIGSAPDWAFWGAACDAAMTKQVEKAFRYLDEATKRGYDDRSQLENSQYLVNLHGLPGWVERLEKLDS